MSGSPYGGTAIFFSKHLKCVIEPVVSDCGRISAILVKFDSFSILLISCYMPCDTPANADTFSQVLGAIQELRIRHCPDYVVYYGGDFNVELCRLQSTQTVSFNCFCSEDNLVSAHSIGNPVKYTYTSGINGSSVHSTIDHFVLSSGLSGSINKHCILEDLENRSDHVPLCIELSLPIDIN